jgi:hypothetical protein
VRLTWSPAPGATTYGVLYSRASGPMTPDPARGSLSTTTTDIEGLPMGSQFTFQVVARDGTGAEVARSNAAPITAMPPPAPGPTGAGSFPIAPTYVATPYVPSGGPSTVWPPPSAAGAPGSAGGAPTSGGQPTAGFTLSSNASEPGSANLQWTPLPSAVSFSIWSSLGGAPLQVSVPNTTNAAAFIPNLPAGQYTFQVHAQDITGNEVGLSNPVSVTVQGR